MSSRPIGNRGFTLLELTVSMGVLTVVGMLSMMAVRAATSSADLAVATADVQSNVRDTMRVITAELQLAPKHGNPSLTPPLQDVQIVHNPAAGAPIEIVFQTPLDGTGKRWSAPIHYRFVNGNNQGVPMGRLVRLQDLDGDGAFTGPKEEIPVGGANDLSNVQFTRNGDVITVTLTASKLVGTRRDHPVSATLTGRVYLLN